MNLYKEPAQNNDSFAVGHHLPVNSGAILLFSCLLIKALCRGSHCGKRQYILFVGVRNLLNTSTGEGWKADAIIRFVYVFESLCIVREISGLWLVRSVAGVTWTSVWNGRNETIYFWWFWNGLILKSPMSTEKWWWTIVNYFIMYIICKLS